MLSREPRAANRRPHRSWRRAACDRASALLLVRQGQSQDPLPQPPTDRVKDELDEDLDLGLTVRTSSIRMHLTKAPLKRGLRRSQCTAGFWTFV